MKPSPRLEILFTREEIRSAIERIAALIQRDYGDKSPSWWVSSRALSCSWPTWCAFWTYPSR